MGPFLESSGVHIKAPQSCSSSRSGCLDVAVVDDNESMARGFASVAQGLPRGPRTPPRTAREEEMMKEGNERNAPELRKLVNGGGGE